MLLSLYVAFIAAIPKFSYILADHTSKSQCGAINEHLKNYFAEDIYDEFDKKKADELSKAFQGFLCTHDDYDIDDAIKNVNSKTELLLIHAFHVDDEIDFDNLKTKMVVHISGINNDEDFSNLLTIEKVQRISSQISEMAKHMFSISYEVNSRSKNIELSKKISSKKSSKKLMNLNPIEIDGEMKKKVSFLAVFDQHYLMFDSDLDCEYVYLYDCELVADDSFKITSKNLLVDDTTYESLYELNEFGKVKVSVDQFGLIMGKEETVRITFLSDDVNFEYSDRSFPQDNKYYESAIGANVPRKWFKTIAVLSMSTQYSLYLDADFNPKKDTLPGINISINEPETKPLTFKAKESVDIKTESANPDAWNQFSTKPNLNVDCDSNQFSVNAPSNIQVSNIDHNKAENNNNKNNKKKLIIIIVCVCVAVIVVVIIIVVVVVKCRNKYDNKIVYIADDQQQQKSAASLNGNQSTNGFTDNMDDKKDEKELSDNDLEKEKEESFGNNQSHNSIESQPSLQYPQGPDSHPGYPPQVTPTGSDTNLPADHPNSAYTVPF